MATMHCPKCRSMSFALLETFTEVEMRQVRNGVVSNESCHEVGTLLSTECSCDDCGHHWTPRRATLDTLHREHGGDW